MRLFNRSDTTLQRATSGARGMFGRIADAGGRAARRLAATGAWLQDTERRVVGAGRSYVREHPLKSSAITLAIGAVGAMAASLFMSRRH